MTLKFHPYADIFPLLEGGELEALAEDIRDNGLQEKIGLYDGEILDGRNRYRALELLIGRGELGDDCLDLACQVSGFYFTSLDACADPLAFVISKNLHRRHLSESQRAMVAAKLATLAPGRPGTPPPQGGGGQKPANLPDYAAGLRQVEAAGLLNVSERSVRHARKVLDGVPELGRAVERGDIKASAAAAIATLGPDEQDAALVKVGSPEWKASVKAAREQATAVKKARRQKREAELGARQRALPNEKFGVILADPEWRFEVRSEAGLDRAADNHYPTSASDVIMARPVSRMAADDAVLFLWATVPMLPDALSVMKAWGFAYKSHFAWVKDAAGTGYWNRNCHELLLVGTRGDVPAPPRGTQWSSVITAPKGRHSEKPQAVYELIEAYFPSLPKIELNARARRPGWEAWGFEAPDGHACPDPGAPEAEQVQGDVEASSVCSSAANEGAKLNTDEDLEIPALLRRLPDGSLSPKAPGTSAPQGPAPHPDPLPAGGEREQEQAAAEETVEVGA